VKWYDPIGPDHALYLVIVATIPVSVMEYRTVIELVSVWVAEHLRSMNSSR
jgi:hypothetical protein